MPTLTIADRQGERIRYEPVLLEVAGESSFNAPDRPQAIRFSGIGDFWTWTEWAAKDADAASPPPKGTVAWFGLKTAPKRGQNATPGALYLDIYSCQRATQEDKDSFDPTVRWQTVGEGQQDAPTGGTGPQTGIDERIAVGMAFNNLTHMLASDNGSTFVTDVMAKQWHKWYDEASRGKPLTPVRDEPQPADDPAYRAARIAPEEDQFEAPPAGVDTEIESLPW